MPIPNSMLGLWQGEVIDANRVKPYAGVLCLDAEAGETLYQMSHYLSTGVTKGKLTEPVEKDGWIVLHEYLHAGAAGLKEDTLSLKLIDRDHLECAWSGANAIMTRVETADTK